MKQDRELQLLALEKGWNFLQETCIAFENLSKLKGDMIQNTWVNNGENGNESSSFPSPQRSYFHFNLISLILFYFILFLSYFILFYLYFVYFI